MGEVYKMIPVLSEVKDMVDREKEKRKIESGKKNFTYSDLLVEKFKGNNK